MNTIIRKTVDYFSPYASIMGIFYLLIIAIASIKMAGSFGSVQILTASLLYVGIGPRVILWVMSTVEEPSDKAGKG